MQKWHKLAAGQVFDAFVAYNERADLDDARDREDVVTVWRRVVHLLSHYANGTDGETQRAFWRTDGRHVDFLRLIKRRSRFNRCDALGGALLERDRISAWEADLARELMRTDGALALARELGKLEPVRRLSRELEVTFKIIQAYTGCATWEIRAALAECEGARPEGWCPEGHPLFELISTNRPVAGEGRE